MTGGSERALDPRVLWIWRFRAVGLTAGVGIPVVTLAVVAAASGVTPALATGPAIAVLLAGLAAAVVLPRLSYERWRYVVGDDWLELRHGVLVHSRSWVPWFRIQHVDVEQGPIERWLGLVHLVVHTASASTDATIPGISTSDAEHVRSLILSRVGSDDGL